MAIGQGFHGKPSPTLGSLPAGLNTAISLLYKLIWPLHVRIRGNWAESVSTLLKNGAIARCLGDTGTKIALSLCWDFQLSNEGSFVEISQEMMKLGWKVSKKSLQSLRAELQSMREESIAVCMQRWSFRRRSLSWETSFDWSEMKVRAFPAVSPHPAVRTWPGISNQVDPTRFFMIFHADHTCSRESRCLTMLVPTPAFSRRTRFEVQPALLLQKRASQPQQSLMPQTRQQKPDFRGFTTSPRTTPHSVIRYYHSCRRLAIKLQNHVDMEREQSEI